MPGLRFKDTQLRALANDPNNWFRSSATKGAAGAGSQLAMGALEDLVAALRAGKAVNPKELPRLMQGIAKGLGRRARGQKNLTQVPDVLNAAPLDSTLQQAVRGGGAAPFPLAPPRPMPPPGFTKPISGLAQGADDVVGQAAAGGKGFGKILAGLAGAGAVGYGMSQMGDDSGEADTTGIPPEARKLMAISHAQGGPQKAGPASGGGRKRLGLPPLPGIQTGVPRGLGESFGTPSDDSLAMEEEVLQGRNPTAGNSFFDATGGRSSQNALLGNMTEQQLDPKKKSLLQALLGGLGKVF